MLGRARAAVGLLRTAVANGYDALALHELSQLPGPSYVPWGHAFAMRPAAVALLVREAKLNRRRLIVELGPGVSTVFLARLLRPGAYQPSSSGARISVTLSAVPSRSSHSLDAIPDGDRPAGRGRPEGGNP